MLLRPRETVPYETALELDLTHLYRNSVFPDESHRFAYGDSSGQELAVRSITFSADRVLFRKPFDDSDRPAVPTNEWGVALPLRPNVECMGAECPHVQAGRPCITDRHHLHSTAVDFAADSKLAEKYRELTALTVWTPDCWHDLHHDKHKLRTAIPSKEVMQQVRDESGLLKQVDDNFRCLTKTGAMASRPEITEREFDGLRKHSHNLLVERKDLLSKLGEIELLPPPLVSGALIVPAPGYAWNEIVIKNSGFALTGTMEKQEVQEAAAYGYAALAYRALYQEALRTGENAVELAA